MLYAISEKEPCYRYIEREKGGGEVLAKQTRTALIAEDQQKMKS